MYIPINDSFVIARYEMEKSEFFISKKYAIWKLENVSPAKRDSPAATQSEETVTTSASLVSQTL
jgi:hypothetical protein